MEGLVCLRASYVRLSLLIALTSILYTTEGDELCGAPCPDNSLCDVILQECRFPCGSILCLPGDVCDSDTVTCQNTRECGDSCPTSDPCDQDDAQCPGKSANVGYFLNIVLPLLLFISACISVGIFACVMAFKALLPARRTIYCAPQTRPDVRNTQCEWINEAPVVSLSEKGQSHHNGYGKAWSDQRSTGKHDDDNTRPLLSRESRNHHEPLNKGYRDDCCVASSPEAGRPGELEDATRETVPCEAGIQRFSHNEIPGISYGDASSEIAFNLDEFSVSSECHLYSVDQLSFSPDNSDVCGSSPVSSRTQTSPDQVSHNTPTSHGSKDSGLGGYIQTERKQFSHPEIGIENIKLQMTDLTKEAKKYEPVEQWRESIKRFCEEQKALEFPSSPSSSSKSSISSTNVRFTSDVGLSIDSMSETERRRFVTDRVQDESDAAKLSKDEESVRENLEGPEESFLDGSHLYMGDESRETEDEDTPLEEP